MSDFFATYQLSGERSGFNHWICGQVAAVTGAPLIYASSQFQDHSEIGSDDCPPTPGDDDDDEDDKDKVSHHYDQKSRNWFLVEEKKWNIKLFYSGFLKKRTIF